MNNKKILILGGTGALGKTLIKRYYDSNEIIVFSRDEHKHYYLLKEFPKLKSFIGDIKDKQSVMACIRTHNPEVIINAAALKHVPICQANPFESVKTNVLGHQNVIDCVAEVGNIESLIFVSTDKACRPINVYGMCKALAEELYINYANNQTTTKVVLVRYGNVLESTGSVIPLFKGMLNAGAVTLPLTHKEMTRFLLTLEQATNLIEDAYNSPVSHGKIAIPKVSSLKILDVANVLVSVYATDRKVDIVEVGIRPGEKLHEEMISEEEWLRSEEYDTHFLIGQKMVTSELRSYNSFDSLLDPSTTYDFLKMSGVFNV
jgi:UDP-N-acetylglucosamine 4,6-dehydratase